jgi:leader peptidase (prepilin peptidase) / N-methyltransferase
MIWVIGFIIGVCLGSLTKVIADRSLTNRTFWGRSYSECCKKQLAWYDLFPIFSYLFLRGKCRYCGKKLSPEYLLIEILMGLLVAGIFVKIVPSDFLNFDLISWGALIIELLIYSLISITLVAVFITDFKTGYIPDRITHPTTWILFILLIISSILKAVLLFMS